MSPATATSTAPAAFDPATFDPGTFNPHDPGFLANPYPIYRWFREHEPIAWVEPYESWWCFTYDDCQRILTGTDLFLKNNPVPSTAAPPPLTDVLSGMPESVFSVDNPRHAEIRPILDGLFARTITDAKEIAATAARGLLTKAKVSKRLDLVSTYALPLPASVLQTVLGVPQGDFMGVMQYVAAVLAANDITAPISVRGAGLTCDFALNAYYQGLSRCPHLYAKGRMFDLMLNEGTKAPHGLSGDDVQVNSVTLSIAGYYSTTFLIGTGTLSLLKHPDQLELLRTKPELGTSAFWEMMRYDGPVQLIDRYVAADTTIAGKALRRGDKVTAVTGSGNHDPAAFPDPERFDITRPDTATKGLSFGSGIHYCLGAPLAEQVSPVAFQVLLDELPGLALAGTPQWYTDPFLRAVSNLPIEFH